MTEDANGTHALQITPEPPVIFIIHGALKEPKPPGSGHRKAHIAQVATATAANVAQIITGILAMFGRRGG